VNLNPIVNDRIVLSKNTLVVAIIRKASLVLADWEILKEKLD
jgi:hypothetical protein